MSAAKKMLITNKLFPHLTSNESIKKFIRNVQVNYLSGSNTCRNDLCDNNLLSKQERELLVTQGHSDDCKQRSKSKTDKNIFMKKIIEGLLSPKAKSSMKPKKIVIDFSSPNIAKPFHVGHLRSTIIGNFIGNINKYYSNDVTRINYLGDWGTQFGMLQFGLKHQNVKLQDLKEDPIKVLFDAYVIANKIAATDVKVQEEARQYFANIEQGHTDLEDWRIIRKLTVKGLEDIYTRLGIKFDDYHWESDYNGKAIESLMKSLEEKGIIVSDESGKKVASVNGRKVTVLKSDNSTLYISRDIAALVDRYNRYEFNEMLYVVDNSQTDHFTAVIDVVRSFNKECADNCKHIKFGRIKGMSTRSGNVVFLNDILDEAKLKMFEKQRQSKNTRATAMDEETCDTLGATAVIINDLKQRRQKDYSFDWNRALQSEGDSGIKLQYLHCRLWSLEQNCGIEVPNECDPSYIKEAVIEDLVIELAKFDNVLLEAKEQYEACILVAYLFRLAKYVNRMFNELKVKGTDVDVDIARQRLLVFHVSRRVVKTGLEILGAKPLYEM